MPEASVEGAMWAAAEGVPVILVGDKVRIEEEFDKRGSELPVGHASDVIEMDDHAADVGRRLDSSISVAMHLVRDGEASGCISMGHSGATMAQVRAQKDNPQFDVVHFSGGQEVPAAEEGLIVPINPSQLANYDDLYPFASEGIARGEDSFCG